MTMFDLLTLTEMAVLQAKLHSAMSQHLYEARQLVKDPRATTGGGVTASDHLSALADLSLILAPEASRA